MGKEFEMDGIILQRNSIVPLYEQLSEALLQKIQTGALSYGSQLPSEMAMAKQCGISRMTARRAIDILVNAGVAVRKPGKGSFIQRAEKSQVPFSSAYSFSRWLSKLGCSVKTKVLVQEVTAHVPDMVREKLGLLPQAKAVFVKRLRYVNEQPVSVQSNYFLYPLLEGLVHADLTKRPLGLVLEQDFHVKTQCAQDVLSASVADKKMASLLNISVGRPLLLMTGVSYSDEGLAFKYTEAVYNADMFCFHMRSDESNMVDLNMK